MSVGPALIVWVALGVVLGGAALGVLTLGIKTVFDSTAETPPRNWEMRALGRNIFLIGVAIVAALAITAYIYAP